MSHCMQINFSSVGTYNTIKMYEDELMSEDKNNEIATKIMKRVQEIDDHMSAFKETSDLSKIISQAGSSYVAVNQDTWEVINRAAWFYKNSDGAFDITVRPLVEIWGIGKKGNFVPSEDNIRNVRMKIDGSKILLSPEEWKVKLDIKEGKIDLGGIAKGYAADETKRILLENGIYDAIINLGGNIVTMGHRPDGSPWKIGIQNPLALRGEFIGFLSATNKTVVTSGSYEQFFIKDRIRYHHILDPRTGYPAKSSLLSVTAVCDNSIDADALTTSSFVLGLDEGLKMMEKTGAEGIFITNKMEVIITNGLKDKFIRNKIQEDKRRTLYVC